MCLIEQTDGPKEGEKELNTGILTATSVPGRKINVISAIVFIVLLSCWADSAISWESLAIMMLFRMSRWDIKLYI